VLVKTKLSEYLDNPRVLLLDSNLAGWLLVLFGLNLSAENYACYASALTKVSPLLKYIWKKGVKYLDIDDNFNILYPSPEECGGSLIIVQHWNGKIVDTASLEGSDSIIIEDCSMALGGKYSDGTRVGNSPNICLFEFNDTTLVRGHGCVLAFPNEEVYTTFEKLLNGILSSLKMSESTCNHIYNQLTESLDDDKMANMSRFNVMLYDEVMCRFKNLDMYFEYMDKGVYPTLLLKITDGSGSENFVNFMASHNIQTSCLELQTIDCPNANRLYNEVVLVPCGHWIDEDKFNDIVNIFYKWEESVSVNKTKPRLIDNGDYHKGIVHLFSLINTQCTNMTFATFKKVIEFEYQYSASKFIYVIERGDIIVATATLTVDYFNFIKSKAYIEYLIVHPDYRHQGVGEQLLSFVLDACETVHNGPSRDDVYIISTKHDDFLLDEKRGYTEDSKYAIYSCKNLQNEL
jgi:GNAT superfamily N-acetyltransferase